MEKLGLEAVDLGFQDALWRIKGGLGLLERKLAFFMPEFAYIYRTYRFHIISGLVDSRDASLLENIEKDLLRLFRDKDKIIIFSPLALGDHVDHVIVRDIVSKMFGQAIFWSDFPYNLEKKKEKGSFAEKNDLKPFSWENLPYGKIKLISSYKTQIKAMFPKGIPVIPEEYFVKAES